MVNPLSPTEPEPVSMAVDPDDPQLGHVSAWRCGWPWLLRFELNVELVW
ncbi:hypothetical protein QJS66_00200 [Kocuria rhizophila]|nr:hypothetical protein QJS66_00200 [Kocuria rhizophila]